MNTLIKTPSLLFTYGKSWLGWVSLSLPFLVEIKSSPPTSTSSHPFHQFIQSFKLTRPTPRPSARQQSSCSLPPPPFQSNQIEFQNYRFSVCVSIIMGEEQQPGFVSISSSSSSLGDSAQEELQHMPLAQPPWKRKWLSKQLSMCETPRDIAWEKRRRQMLHHERRRNGVHDYCDDLTDEDLNELKGCIELGFGFNEEDGQMLCGTLPALDLYFAVNRQLSPSPFSTPHSHSHGSSSSGSPSSDPDTWRICSPGLITFYDNFLCAYICGPLAIYVYKFNLQTL